MYERAKDDVLQLTPSEVKLFIEGSDASPSEGNGAACFESSAAVVSLGTASTTRVALCDFVRVEFRAVSAATITRASVLVRALFNGFSRSPERAIASLAVRGSRASRWSSRSQRYVDPLQPRDARTFLLRRAFPGTTWLRGIRAEWGHE